MNFIADESVDAQIVDRVRTDGHDVESVAEMSPSISDDVVLDRANSTQSLLMTGDKDFGEMIFRLRRVTLGVILVRLSGLSAPLKAELISEAIRVHGDEMLHAFTVISPGLVRIRHEM